MEETDLSPPPPVHEHPKLVRHNGYDGYADSDSELDSETLEKLMHEYSITENGHDDYDPINYKRRIKEAYRDGGLFRCYVLRFYKPDLQPHKITFFKKFQCFIKSHSFFGDGEGSFGYFPAADENLTDIGIQLGNRAQEYTEYPIDIFKMFCYCSIVNLLLTTIYYFIGGSY